MTGLPDHVRLHEIEMELDKTAGWEAPPYRGVRARLNRERSRILKRLKGEDTISGIERREVAQDRYSRLGAGQKMQYQMNRRVGLILDALERDKEGPWREYKKQRGWT